MDYQSTKIVINKIKRIGSVIFIVEGPKDANLLRLLFNNVLDYQTETLISNQTYQKYKGKHNKNSRVFVINGESSNIKTIGETSPESYLFQELNENHGFDVRYSRIFYIYDRDSNSNKDPNLIRDFLRRFNSSFATDTYDQFGGLLLLSYPSSESYTISCFTDEQKLFFRFGNQAKRHIGIKNYQPSRINSDYMCKSVEYMLKEFEQENCRLDFDDWSNTNIPIFNFQEGYYLEHKLHPILSLLSIAFLDLGIIDIID